MKNYIAELDTSLMNDGVLNPAWPQQGRSVGIISKLIVHHEAEPEAYAYEDAPRYEAEAQYQNNSSIPGSKGLQYHFKIDNVGQIMQIRPYNMVLWHAANLPVNTDSLGICMDGNFMTQEPTREQFEALKQLLDWLCTQHPEFPAVQSDVYGHTEVSQEGTSCPGTNLIGFVQAYRNTGGNAAIPDQAVYQHPELQPDYVAPTTTTTTTAAPAPVEETTTTTTTQVPETTTTTTTEAQTATTTSTTTLANDSGPEPTPSVWSAIWSVLLVILRFLQGDK